MPGLNPRTDLLFSCHNGGLWYACTEQTPFFQGCCKSNPCGGAGCPAGDVPAGPSSAPASASASVASSVASLASESEPPSTPSAVGQASSASRAPAILGGIVGAAVLFALIVTLISIRCRQKTHRESQSSYEHPTQYFPPDRPVADMYAHLEKKEHGYVTTCVTGNTDASPASALTIPIGLERQAYLSSEMRPELYTRDAPSKQSYRPVIYGDVMLSGDERRVLDARRNQYSLDNQIANRFSETSEADGGDARRHRPITVPPVTLHPVPSINATPRGSSRVPTSIYSGLPELPTRASSRASQRDSLPRLMIPDTAHF